MTKEKNQNRQTTVTIKLDFPVVFKSQGPEPVSEITLRRPKVRDRLVADKVKGSDFDQEVAMVANLCMLTPEEVADLDLADYVKFQTELQGFLGRIAG